MAAKKPKGSPKTVIAKPMPPGKKAGELTPKMALFALLLISDPRMDATKAAIGAGYSEKTAHVKGSQLLRHQPVKAAVDAAMAKRADKLGLDADWVLKRLKSISDRCMQAEPVLDAEGEETGWFKFDSAGANKATELVGKHMGMFEKSGAVSLEKVQELMNDLGMAVLAAIQEVVPDENLRSEIVRAVDRRWEHLNR